MWSRPIHLGMGYSGDSRATANGRLTLEASHAIVMLALLLTVKALNCHQGFGVDVYNYEEGKGPEVYILANPQVQGISTTRSAALFSTSGVRERE